MNRRQLGTEKEKLAEEKLIAAGYEILERNFRCRQGEIDRIARHKGYLVFIEVKYRKGIKNGYPEEAVDGKKQKIICRTAVYYLRRQGLGEHTPCRFDVVAITGADVRIYQNAFAFQGG